MRIQAWAPGHSTLVFAVPEQHSEPLLMGSLGGGFNFQTGVLTSISQNSRDQVLWNSRVISGEVTLTALDRFREKYDIDDKFEINHYSELKIGHGLSTSGAGSLGVVLALNELTGTNVDEEELHKIAHYADIVNHTGLGSVMGQITGGIELRTEIGGPGIGETSSISCDDMIIILQLGKLKTSDVLVSETQMKQVTEVGQEAMTKINNIQGNYTEEIIRIGRKFSETCGLLTDRIQDILQKLEDIGEERASMAMIGETVIVYPRDAEAVVNFARKYRIDCVVTQITDSKPMIVSNSA